MPPRADRRQYDAAIAAMATNVETILVCTQEHGKALTEHGASIAEQSGILRGLKADTERLSEIIDGRPGEPGLPEDVRALGRTVHTHLDAHKQKHRAKREARSKFVDFLVRYVVVPFLTLCAAAGIKIAKDKAGIHIDP